VAENKQNILVKPENILGYIDAMDCELRNEFDSKFLNLESISRLHVSFQDNKTRAIYRWYKFKEAFSASLVEFLLDKYRISIGRLLDPFAGSGTTLFAASESGIDVDGIELLPIGQKIIETRKLLDSPDISEVLSGLTRWVTTKPWEYEETTDCLNELRITKNAYPERTKLELEKYLNAAKKENPQLRIVLIFSVLCILETISYTRKDGQYLRWDHRSERRQGNHPFDKGYIPSFSEAITSKFKQIICDIQNPDDKSFLWKTERKTGVMNLHSGSCLEIMPKLQSDYYDAIITSPPYCNRYDYTRTYALELALLGTDETELVRLRQDMLSCTVENRSKDLLNLNPEWRSAIDCAENQGLLQAILEHLNVQKDMGKLNNNGIPRMVSGYFYEMACVIQESARVLKPNAPLFMVNDNVRYDGVSISVDLILSKIAECLGFRVEHILVLQNGKGNSSQQMGEYGRKSLRKCIYVWRKNG
jgi:DNA modification methylase